MSDLVIEFYKTYIQSVIISVCQFLTAVVVLPKTDNSGQKTPEFNG